MSVHFLSLDRPLFHHIYEKHRTLREQGMDVVAKATYVFPTRRMVGLYQEFLLKQRESLVHVVPRLYTLEDLWKWPGIQRPSPPTPWALHSAYIHHVKNQMDQNQWTTFPEIFAQALTLSAFKELLDGSMTCSPHEEMDGWLPKGHENFLHGRLLEGLEHLPSMAGHRWETLRALEAKWHLTPWPDHICVFNVIPDKPLDHAFLSLFMSQPLGALFFTSLPDSEPVGKGDEAALYHPNASIARYRGAQPLHGRDQSPRLRFVEAALGQVAPPPGNLDPGGFYLYSAPDLQDETQMITAILKEAALDPSRPTAALVTPHGSLAKRVRLALEQDGLKVDAAAGIPFFESPAPLVAMHVLDWLNAPQDDTKRLALLKHPLTTFGLESGLDIRLMARRWEALRQSVFDPSPSFQDPYMDRLEAFAQGWPKKASLQDFLRHHQEILKAIAPDAMKHEDLCQWFEDVQTMDLSRISSKDYQFYLEKAFLRLRSRANYGTHPRIYIWDLTQAQGVQPDWVILGGMNASSWMPSSPPIMGLDDDAKESLNLPSMKQKTAARTMRLLPLFMAPKVFMTRSEREEGALSLPSPLWERFHLVANASNHGEKLVLMDPQDRQKKGYGMGREISPKPVLHPADTPMYHLSVTQLESLMADPFVFCLQKSLGVTPLEAPATPDDPRIFGQLIHQMAHEITMERPLKSLEPLLENPMWHWRARRILQRFTEQWQTLQKTDPPQKHHGEISGTLTLGAWVISGRADHLDETTRGTCRIIDYKTGMLPARKAVIEGPRVQLAVLGAMAQKGGFHGIAPKPVERLSYWFMAGDHRPFEEMVFDSPTDLIDTTLARVQETLAFYETASLSPQIPTTAPFDQMARIPEWLQET